MGYFGLSDSPYGTFDQGGNVWEWNEAILQASYRGIRGGSFFETDPTMHAGDRAGYHLPRNEYSNVGFRVAAVPEPGTIVMLAFGALLMLRRGRGRG